MNKVFVALRKARDDKQWEVERHGEVFDLLSPTPTVPNESTQASSPPKKKGRSWWRNKGDTGQEGVDERLVALHAPTTLAAEQYRKLYTEIASFGRAHPLQTLLVASAMAGEGKTTSALNLAITMSVSGGERDVLVVDADLRSPSLHTYLGTQPVCGLAEYVRGEVEYAQLFTKTSIPGLTAVYAGHSSEHPFTLLSSEKMQQFFEQVKAQACYRYILVDSSPVLLTSETKTLLPYVDAALLVVRAGKTSKDMLEQAIEALGEEHILGLLFNGVADADLGNYRQYYKAGYGTISHGHNNAR